MGIKPNTALSWLRRLVKKGLFVMKEKGTYVRARVCVC
jgi:Mn-dependent DtxR family transcriptional regulator